MSHSRSGEYYSSSSSAHRVTYADRSRPAAAMTPSPTDCPAVPAAVTKVRAVIIRVVARVLEQRHCLPSESIKPKTKQNVGCTTRVGCYLVVFSLFLLLVTACCFFGGGEGEIAEVFRRGSERRRLARARFQKVPHNMQPRSTPTLLYISRLRPPRVGLRAVTADRSVALIKTVAARKHPHHKKCCCNT